MLIDAHCHLDDPAYDDDRDAVVQRARSLGVASWIVSGTEPATWDRTAAVAHHTGGLATLGVHPWFADRVPDPASALQQLADRELSGIGEIGLDWARASQEAQRSRQRQLFRSQLALARERNVPVVVHCVRAYADVLQILTDDGLPDAGGLLHAFGGPLDAVRRATQLGLILSFGPQIGRDRAKKARAAAVAAPLEHVVVESDGPEPGHTATVLQTLATLRGEGVEVLTHRTTRNLRRLFPHL
ncbi:MAG: TatD family hydrolase [Myxococcales bacterium]|nr:TatD family hydrolase [Myxococcales bacterium]